MATMHLGIFVVTAILASPNVFAEGPWNGAGEYYLKADEIVRLRKLAMRGGNEAANQLSRYYSIYEGNLSQGEFWLRVAAENGDCEAAKEVFDRFDSAAKRDEKEVVYWESRLQDLRCNAD